jgi:hypothetical protein
MGETTQDAALLAAILDSLREPVLFGDTGHVARYMNRAAMDWYEKGEDYVGTSLLECHNERSQRMMVDILAEMREGLEEQLITDSEEHRIYMRAVRDPRGKLLGYYERYAEPSPEADPAS